MPCPKTLSLVQRVRTDTRGRWRWRRTMTGPTQPLTSPTTAASTRSASLTEAKKFPILRSPSRCKPLERWVKHAPSSWALSKLLLSILGFIQTSFVYIGLYRENVVEKERLKNSFFFNSRLQICMSVTTKVFAVVEGRVCCRKCRNKPPQRRNNKPISTPRRCRDFLAEERPSKKSVFYIKFAKDTTRPSLTMATILFYFN